MQLIGHRGARAEMPENTLAGFQYIKDLGLDAVEFDVRQLADGTLCIVHDDNFLRTASVEQNVEQCHVADLAKYNQAWHFQQSQDAGNLQHLQKYDAFQRTPTLAETLQIISNFNHIEIEIKAVASPQHAERLVAQLDKDIQQYFSHRVDAITMTSFDAQILTALQAYPQYQKGLLMELPLAQHTITLAQQLDCQRIGWRADLLTQDLVKQAHNVGLLVSVWTVNDVEQAKQFQAWGVDGLISDKVSLMLKSLNI
ncbi:MULTISPECIES: glycerophosphodiester phosphodiesterase [unclassified Acinetobacter]|uniref:glycerophosphodiester phosphodiesterase n=1 Tax=unclassified Acinetobacter TaxID=196816 RepID=UPI0035BA12B7